MDIYIQKGSFTLPESNPNTLFDVLGDGRLVTSDGSAINIEDSVGTRQFSLSGTVPSGPPSFMRVSPDSALVAVGNDSKVTVFPFTDLAHPHYFMVSSYDGEWLDHTRLAFSGVGAEETSGTVVSVLDIPTKKVQTLIQGIAGASAGVTIDGLGNVYAGNGYAGAGQEATGTIKAFRQSEWEAALSSNQPLDFEKSGTLVANLLSAAFLGFDADGNLHVGGGDNSTQDAGYAAVVSRAALQEALGGGPPVEPDDLTKLQRLDPDPSNNFWLLNSNRVTGELYLKDYNSPTVYSYERA